MEKEVLNLIDDKEFNEYYNKRLGTEVNPNLPKELYNKSELDLIKNISDKISFEEILVSSNTIVNLIRKISKFV
jgi:hypothetical protein